jgi:PadR family transcriptional regulator, regulatory protein PadR
MIPFPQGRVMGCETGAPRGIQSFRLTFYQKPVYTGRMSTRNENRARESLLQGTLDLLVLRVLALGAHHGHGIALAISERSGETLLVDHGSLYPALQRLEQRGWIKGAWGTSSNNRRARFYTLTATGHRQLTIEAGRWNRLVESIARVMEPDPPPTPEKA